MDFCIERYYGNSLVLPVALTDSNGDPISLVCATIKFRIGDITEASEGYSIARNDVAGAFTITISASLMATLQDPVYYFGCDVTYASGIRQTLFVGKLTLKDNVVL
ncbi:MAG: hypothetical protein PHQ34_13835 [Methanothrix sp.]|nr:hypothetical protein [Methanothrix sp.]